MDLQNPCWTLLPYLRRDCLHSGQKLSSGLFSHGCLNRAGLANAKKSRGLTSLWSWPYDGAMRPRTQKHSYYYLELIAKHGKKDRLFAGEDLHLFISFSQRTNTGTCSGTGGAGSPPVLVWTFLCYRCDLLDYVNPSC